MKKWLFLLPVGFALLAGCKDEKCDLPVPDPGLWMKTAFEVHYPRSQSDRMIGGEASFAAARIYVAPKMDPEAGLPVVPDLSALESMAVRADDSGQPFQVKAVDGDAFSFDVTPSRELFPTGGPASVPVKLNITLTDKEGATYTDAVTVTFYPSRYDLPVVTLKKSVMDANPDEWIRDYFYDLRAVLVSFGVTEEFFTAHPMRAVSLAGDGYGPLGPEQGGFPGGFELSSLDPMDAETFKNVQVEDMILSSYPAGSYHAHLMILVTDPNSNTQMISALVCQEIRLLDE